jgi:thymidylate kinase
MDNNVMVELFKQNEIKIQSGNLMNGNRSFYQELIDYLNEREIHYCLLRDTDLNAADLDELDLLVWPEHRRKFETVMGELDFVPRKSGIPRKEVFAYFDGEKLRILDVHYAFVQDGIIYMPISGVYYRLIKTPEGYKTLSPEDQLLHLFYHNLIGKKHMQSKHLQLVKELLRGLPDMSYMTFRIGNSQICQIFEQFVQNPGQFTDDRKMAARAAKKIRRELTFRSPANLWRSYYNRNLKRLFHRRRGVHFAFMGVDGAGKSTVIKAVQEQLQHAGNVKFYRVYMGPWGEIRSPLFRWFRKLKLGVSKEDWSHKLRQKLQGEEKKHSLFTIVYKLISGKIQGWLYYIFLYSEFWYRYFRDVQSNMKKGAIVLSDRYIYDVRYIYKDRPMHQFKLMRRLMCYFYPHPDRIVYLQNTPEVIRSRKPQLGEKEIRQFQQFYHRALAKYPVLEIQTNQSPEAIGREIVKSIMHYYVDEK